MYSPDDLDSPSQHDVVRRLERTLFPGGSFTPEGAASVIAWEARICGVDATVHEVDDWHVVKGDHDWFPSEANPFERLLAFPEAGVNASRLEVVLPVFAATVVTSLDGAVSVVVDRAGLAREVRRRFADLLAQPGRVIIFRK